MYCSPLLGNTQVIYGHYIFLSLLSTQPQTQNGHLSRFPAPVLVTSQASATYWTKHEPYGVIKPQLKFRWICLMNKANGSCQWLILVD
jgi:hypothetical protein